MWLGVDDTDSPRGGCTTFVLTELVRLARAHRLDVLGEPRLVRLNPNIPWKTRGNAALAVRLGHGRGARRWVGEVDGRPVWSFAGGREPSRPERASYLAEAWERVRAAADGGGPGTDPALVAVDRLLPADVYWNAVRTVVPVASARAVLERAGAWVRFAGEPQGLVGAAAAVAWPGLHPTWELIAYRPPGRWGRPRSVDARSVRSAQREFPHLFLCHDARTRRVLVAPHTPCPILYGLRATDPGSARRARRRIRSEPVERFLLFRTNQGTGDHLVDRELGPWPALTSGRVAAPVVDRPQVLPGGHVRFAVGARADIQLGCVAFEPTKTLPRVARALRPGDRVQVWGSRGDDGVLRLEGIRVLARAPETRPPPCPACGRRLRSLGQQRGYRCARCRRRVPPEAALRSSLRTSPPLGTYHPTPSARRHLAPRGPESETAVHPESF